MAIRGECISAEIQSGRDVIVRTPQLAAAVRSYESKLGFPVTHRDSALVGVETGSFTVHIESGAARARRSPAPRAAGTMAG